MFKLELKLITPDYSTLQEIKEIVDHVGHSPLQEHLKQTGGQQINLRQKFLYLLNI
jgi:hypothetical protein